MTAVVCDDDPTQCSAVAEQLVRAGCGLVVQTPSLVQLLDVVSRTMPNIIVLDLALAGIRGLDVVRDLHRTCTECALIVLSPFVGLRDDAIAAGARALVDVRDLRDLDAVLATMTAPIELDVPAPRAAAETSERTHRRS